jgi:subtilisin family serine protease
MSNITQGVWTLKLTGLEITDGKFDIWLPTSEEVSNQTAFFVPSLQTTLTLPSCAEKVITVGGYDAAAGTIAPFSGRGYTRSQSRIKPDLIAPAVNIVSCSVNGGYGQFTGTSMAAPFAAGSAALLMQWGIVQGNDPYLYGQRIKAFMIKGAKRSKSITYPNETWGYGTLCLESVLDYLLQYIYID